MLLKIAIYFVLVVFSTTAAAAQYPLPLADKSYHEAGEFIFRGDEVMIVNITMDPADLQWLLDNRGVKKYRQCDVQLINSRINESFKNVGIRPRGNTARQALKNPWKLDFAEFVSGRKVHGVQKLNLGSEASDPSQSRSTMAYHMFRSMGVPASRTHYVWLTINDGSVVQGLYTSVEQVDDDFVDAWFGNDNGVLYKCRHITEAANLTWKAPGTATTYQDLDAYEEKLQDDNFQPFAEFIAFIDQASDNDFNANIDSQLNVDGFLRALAVDMLIGQWDGLWLGANNFYLYQNTRTSKWEYLPWDLDQSFGMDYWRYPIIGKYGTDFASRAYRDWGKGGYGMNGVSQPPLIERLLNIPEYNQQLQRYVQLAAAGEFHPRRSTTKLDRIKKLLKPYAFQGTYSAATMDNGYTPLSFEQAFDFPATYQSTHVPTTWGIKPFIAKRTQVIQQTYPQPPATPTVCVNELVAKNKSGIVNEKGEREDWLELYNFGKQDVDLSAMYLSDYAGANRGWNIPAGTVLAAGEYLLIWCDKQNQLPLHADFKLAAANEGVYLWQNKEHRHTLIDSALYQNLGDDQAWARDVDGVGKFRSAAPTPRAKNQ
jgi:spore coat protein CotH